MYTGMRAGELAQLLVEDFVFDAVIPHLKVRRENKAGEAVKSVKNKNSVRDIPLAEPLLKLGLADFVAERAKFHPRERVFGDFTTGLARNSGGLTKFWSAYLKRVGLWKKGRAVHVWRHTVVDFLRANGLAIEDIAAIVGHGTDLMTEKYGGAHPLARKLATIKRLDFGFDVVGMLNANDQPS